jgi:hypothetical protein
VQVPFTPEQASGFAIPKQVGVKQVGPVYPVLQEQESTLVQVPI